MKVKLSNKEHYFTPDEVATLKANGVNLDALAPNANGGNGKARGGYVLGGPLEDYDNEDILKKSADKKEKDAETKRLAEQYDLRQENKQKRQDALSAFNLGILNSQTRIDEATKNLEKIIAGKYSMQTQEDAEQQLKEARVEKRKFTENYNRYKDDNNFDSMGAVKPSVNYKFTVPESIKNTQTTSTSPLVKNAITLPAHTKPEFVDNGKGPNKTVENGQTTNAKKPAPANAPSTIPVKKSALSSKVDNTFVDAFGVTQPIVRPKETMAQSKAANAQMTKIAPLQTQIDNPIKSVDQINIPPATDPGTDKKKDAEAKQSFDLVKGFSAIQLGLGSFEANKLGSLTPDTIPADFLAVGDQLKKESGFGLSDLAMKQAKDAIEMNRRMQVKNVIGQAGGDSGVVLGNLGAAGLEADNAVNNLAVDSEKLRYAKLLGYGNFTKDKMAASNRIYDKYEDRFKNMEMADANLIGSGVKNLIEGDRYDKVLAAQKDRDAVSSAPTYQGSTKWTKANIRSLSTDKTDTGYITKAKEKGVDFNTLPEND